MMRKFTTCLMLYSCFLLSSCDDEKEALKPKPVSLTVNTAAGKANDTDFTFTINDVNADSYTLFPYGKDKFKLGTVSISPSSFKGGVATVTFKYAHVGTFSAVVVSNNHTDDGLSVKNEDSNQLSITITSDKSLFSKFSLDYVKDSKTKIAPTTVSPDPLTAGANITVTFPFGVDVTKLTAVFQADPFAVVKIGSAVQKSGETVNDFTTPLTYTVVSEDGSVSTNYQVTVIETPAEQFQGFKSVMGTLASTNAKSKVIPAYADSVDNFIVFYDTLGTSTATLDSIRFGYTLNGKFAKVKGVGDAAMKQDSLFKSIASPQGTQNVVVIAQDELVTDKTYALYAVDAPELTLSFDDDLMPANLGKNTNFGIQLSAPKSVGKSIETYFTIDSPSNVTVVSVKVGNTTITSGDVVNYTQPVDFNITVNDANIGKTYVVKYTATLTQL